MRLWTNLTLFGASLGVLCFGCASETARQKPASYSQLEERERQAERQEFIEETDERIAEIEQEIAHLQAKLEHESQFVDSEQEAAWDQEIFDLQQQKDQLQAELERAKTASPEQWAQMRGTLGSMTDSLEATAAKLSAEVSQVFASGDEETMSARAGLCPLWVEGIEAELDQQKGDRVVVELTTDDPQAVDPLRARASQMAQSKKYRHEERHAEQKESTEETEQAGKQPLDWPQQSGKADSTTTRAHSTTELDVSSENIDGGVRLIFVPKGGQTQRLYDQLENDAERLEEGQCAAVATDAQKD